MNALIAEYGVLIVMLIIFAGEIGIPTFVPGEIAILVAGSQVVHSVPQLVGVWLLFGVVDVLACSSINLLSRTTGNRLLLMLLKRLMGEPGRRGEPGTEAQAVVVERWRGRLRGKDSLVVFVTRMIPMFRLYASISTGLIRVRFRSFLTGAVPASFLWASIPLTVGYSLRHSIGRVESQYPQFIRWVILFSITTTISLGVAAWVRGADSKEGGFRRLRLVLGTAAVGGALARLSLVAAYGDGPLAHRSFLLPMSSLSIWTAVLCAVAAGLAWIVRHDLHRIRGAYVRAGLHVRTLRAAGWIALMGLFCLLNTVASFPHADPVLGLI